MLVTNTTTNPTCGGGATGSIYVVVTGGVTPYTYVWSDGVTTLSSNSLQAGYYYLTITDANGCTVSDFDSIVEPHSFNINQTVSYLPGCNANIAISQQGGATPISYQVNGMATADSVYNNSVPGTYFISAVDRNQCQSQTTVYIGPITDSTQFNEPTCDHPDTGLIAILVLGGNPPFSYRWNNSDTTNIIRNLAAGNYSVTVTDSNGCQSTHVYNLTTSANSLNHYAWVSVTNANCATNGSISVDPYGGTAPYNYYWNTVPPQTTATAVGLPGGTYNVTVTDSIGCVSMGTATVGYACNGVLSGIAFVDTNHNCIFDAGEETYPHLLVEAISPQGTIYYGNTNVNGSYHITVQDTGHYTVIAGSNYNNACTNATICNNNAVVYFGGNTDSIPNYNFGITPATGFDLAMHPGWTSASPGFEKRYWIYYYNQSNLNYYGPVTVTFQYDSNLIFLSSDVAYTTYNAATHTLTWSVDSANQNWDQIGFIHFNVPANLNPGYLLQSTFTIDPTNGDCDISNNIMHFSEIVTGSHDPNEKTVEPSWYISPDDSLLTYTIHFQNTGTASTAFIVVKDTLSHYLDPASVVNLASSLKYSIFNISGGGILTWEFNPGVLPDSIADAQGSKGFITFSVKKKRSAQLNAVISNTASIYFDYNKAVVTNTVTDTVAIPLNITEPNTGNQVTVNAYPNPFKDATTVVVTGLNLPFNFDLYDLSGRMVKHIAASANDRIQLLRDELAPGMYLFGIDVSGKRVAYGKLVAE